MRMVARDLSLDPKRFVPRAIGNAVSSAKNELMDHETYAARAEGLAGVITTMAIRDEARVRELLHVPDDLVVAGVIALGHPVHQPKKLRRAPVGQFATVDRFDGAALGAS